MVWILYALGQNVFVGNRLKGVKMNKDYLEVMIEIDKLNDEAKKDGDSFFIIKQAKYIDGRVYAISKLFNFVEANIKIYENAKIINMTNVFGDSSKSISVPVYEKPKVVIGSRYFVNGQEIGID